MKSNNDNEIMWGAFKLNVDKNCKNSNLSTGVNNIFSLTRLKKNFVRLIFKQGFVIIQ